MSYDRGATESIWMATFNVPKFESLKTDIKCEVCVVGAGISGLTAAYMLLRSGKKVVIVDDNQIGGGESSRTTAHITNVIDNRFSEIERLHGAAAAKLAAESQKEAVSIIEGIITHNQIDCDFARVKGYLLFKPDEKAEMDKEFEACVKAGVDVRISENIPIESFKKYHSLEFDNQAEFHMLKYLSGLAGLITAMGGKIYTGTHIKNIKDGKPVTAITSSEIKITADDIIIATNSPISDYVAIHTKQIANRTYVIGINIPKDSVPHALYWDTEEPYHYVRLYKQQRYDVLIVGGEDHKTGQDNDPKGKFNNLYSWATEKFPMAENIAYKWSGQVMEPFDGLSFIGKDPENSEHVYLVTGDSGMGITHATYAAVILDDLINGRENKWASLYDPKRITMKTAPEFISEGLNAVIQYIDIFTPPEAAYISEIPAGSGAIMDLGSGKQAVYKDIDGRIYWFSALCPHLKCVVNWNKLEKTWDCPCHGSRFSAKGKIINGPALSDLKSIK